MRYPILLATAILLLISTGCQKTSDPTKPGDSSSGTQQGHTEQEQKNPQESLETAIPHAISLLEEKKYEEFLSAYISPKERENILDSKSIKEFAQGFATNKSQPVLMALKEIKDQKPELNEDGSLATWKLSPELNDQIGKGTISLKKIDHKWYLKN